MRSEDKTGTPVVNATIDQSAKPVESSLNSEKRLAAYLRATTDAVYVMSPDWSEMRQLSGSGFLADTAHPNKSWMDPYIPIEARARVGEAIREAVESRSMFQLEHPVRRSDGTTGWTLSRAIPLLDEQARSRSGSVQLPISAFCARTTSCARHWQSAMRC